MIQQEKVVESVRARKTAMPYVAEEGKELTIHTVCYDYESYYGDAHVFITLNAEDGTLLYGTSSSGFLDLT